jgi:hypothetical protein
MLCVDVRLTELHLALSVEVEGATLMRAHFDLILSGLVDEDTDVCMEYAQSFCASQAAIVMRCRPSG